MTSQFLNDVANDAVHIETKIDTYVIISSSNSEKTCKLIKRIPGSRLFAIQFLRLNNINK